MKFDLIYIVTISVMMLLSDLFVSSRCFRHRLGCDRLGCSTMGCQKCEIKLLMVNNQFDLKNLDLDRSQGVVQKDMVK
ncbi:hypothetical protein HanPSC8_Chr15g0647851 [Helianthus annuus]|nr:hypothetical protein HanPSC8_Chr15g0647851 [Helianthus annuus]